MKSQMNRMLKVLLAIVVLNALVCAGTAWAKGVALINPLFEDPNAVGPLSACHPGQYPYPTWQGVQDGVVVPAPYDSVPQGQMTNYPSGWKAVNGTDYADNIVEYNPNSTDFAGVNGVSPLPSPLGIVSERVAGPSQAISNVTNTLYGGALKAPTLGSQACYNASGPLDNDIAVVADCQGSNGVAQTGIILQPNKQYTETISVGQGLINTDTSGGTTAPYFAGFSMEIADLTGSTNLVNAEYHGTGQDVPNPGTFYDYAVTFNGNDFITGKRGGAKAGDVLEIGFVIGTGTYVTDVRMDVSTARSYWSGTGAWDNGTTANWSTTSGGNPTGTYNQLWVAGTDAVFEGTAGTITVADAGISSVNSIRFTTDGYTLGGNGAITLIGAGGNITTGAGTDTIGCPIAGNVGLTKNGAGTLILTGANTYTSGTTVGAGTLQIGNGGTSGSILGDVNNLANLTFNHSGTFTYGGVISGTGSVDIAGPSTSTTVFTGAHLYNGVTTIHDANTLQLGPGGSLSGDTYVNGANAVLAFNRTDTMTYAGNIYGSGGVTQMATGHTILTGANSYTGTTTVQHGYLEINNATAVTNLISAGANLTGGELMLDYTGSSPIASVLAALTSGKITDSAITIHAGPGAMALGWKDTGTQIDILPTLIGDTDLNGTVDNNDLGQLLKYFNKAGGWTSGDFNNNGTVDNSDLGALLANFNHAPLTLPLVVSGGVSTVPEPSSLIMLLTLATAALGIFAYTGRRRRRAA